MKVINLVNVSVKDAAARIQLVRSKSGDVSEIVSGIIQRVIKEGDQVLFELTKKFDGADLRTLLVSVDEIKAAYSQVTDEQVEALKEAKNNIEIFHRACLREKDPVTETLEGVETWREFRAIEKVGLYVPGGLAAYPSTALMLGVPAQIAKCQEIIICTPCNQKGECNPLVLVAADLCGIKKIYKVGGAQAIAAMAYGTESIPKTYKIFGPGNQFVSTAKELVQKNVAIDMPAGPSEVLIIADDTANPKWVAADLLSQLEHGRDSQSILVTFHEEFALKVKAEINRQLEYLSRRDIIEDSLKLSFIVIASSVDEAAEITNEYAPEHLEIITQNDEEFLSRINNFGSAFLGEYTSEPLGDYATGTNHTLPTSGSAKMYGPLSIESFGKMAQVQRVSKSGFERLSKTVSILADAEGLTAHKNCIKIRQ